MDGEIDHGLTAGIEAAATIVLDDPLFGWYAYCGELQQTNGILQVIPRDGVRQRMHVLTPGHRLRLTLDADGFKRDPPVEIMPAVSGVLFVLENRIGRPHTVKLTMEGFPHGMYQVFADGKNVSLHTDSAGKKIICLLQVKEQPEIKVIIRPVTAP